MAQQSHVLYRLVMAQQISTVGLSLFTNELPRLGARVLAPPGFLINQSTCTGLSKSLSMMVYMPVVVK